MEEWARKGAKSNTRNRLWRTEEQTADAEAIDEKLALEEMARWKNAFAPKQSKK